MKRKKNSVWVPARTKTYLWFHRNDALWLLEGTQIMMRSLHSPALSLFIWFPQNVGVQLCTRFSKELTWTVHWNVIPFLWHICWLWRLRAISRVSSFSYAIKSHTHRFSTKKGTYVYCLDWSSAQAAMTNTGNYVA